MRKLLATVSLLALAAQAHATTYYVTPTGKDTNACTSAAPCLTLQHAADKTKPGDTVKAAKGVYGPFKAHISGTSVAWITFDGTSTATVRKDGTAWNGIEVSNGVNYIRVTGWHVVGDETLTYTRVKSLISANKYNLTTNGNCIGTGSHGHHIIIDHNSVAYCPGAGILSLADYTTISYNTVAHTSHWATNAESGITVNPWNADASTAAKIFINNNLVHDNILYICNGGILTWPCGIYDGQGIIADSNWNNSYTGRTEIFNNIVYNNGEKGIIVFRSSHVDIYANTAYNDNQSVTQPAPFTGSQGGGEIMADNSSDINIYNNILVSNPASYALYGNGLSPTNLAVTGLNWGYNVIWAGINPVAYGPGDIVADPQFNPVAGPGGTPNFHLQPTSPAIGTGYQQPWEPAKDYYANPRYPTRPDRGAVRG